MSKINIVTKDPFDIIKSAVDKAVNLIKPTYGPASNKVIISKVTHGLIVDDGVQIIRDLELPDANENAVLKVIRNVAITTNDKEGDGTTGSLIMLQSIIDEVSKKYHREGHKIEKEIKAGLKEAVDQLRSQQKPVKTFDELKKVARISYDNEEIAEIIADTWFKLGKDGVITVDSGPTMKTTAEISEGIKLDHGYISPLMVNNPQRMEAVLDNPLILITDYRITEGSEIVSLMNKMLAIGKRKLLIIAENVEQQALATMVINESHLLNPQTQRPGEMQSVAVVGPTGDESLSYLEDIALLTGGRVFSQSKGDKIENLKIEDLGKAERVISKKDGTVIVGPKGKKTAFKEAISHLQKAIESAESQKDKEKLQKRLAFFSNKIAVIRVGAPTEQEQRALRYKIEDSINAVKSAFKGGVACGGGLALSRLETSSPILNAALKAPYKQLLDNMGGISPERQLKADEGFNVITGKIGKFMDVGVVDPVNVLIAGIESAVSISSLLITTSGMVVEEPKHIKEE